MSGNVYLCKWGKKGNEFKLTLDKYPNICAVGKSFYECEDDIYQQLLEEFGDSNGIIQYEEPYPEGIIPSKYLHSKIYRVSSNASGFLSRSLDEYYTKGKCKSCGISLGNRTELELTLDYFPSSCDSIFLEGVNACVVSEHMLNSLGLKSFFGARKVNSLKPSRKKYFELIGNEYNFSQVAIKDPEFYFGQEAAYKCGTCGKKNINYYDGVYIRKFYSQKDISLVPEDCFLLSGRLFIKSRYWNQHKQMFKKTLIEPQTVAPLSEINPEVSFEIR